MTNTTRAENNRSTSSCPRKFSVDSISLCAALALERHDTTDKLELMQSEAFSSLENRRRSLVKEQAGTTSDDVLEKPSLQHRASYILWASDGENVDNDIDFASIFQASDMSWIAGAVPFPEPASSSPLSANPPPYTRDGGQIPVVSPIRGSHTKRLDDDGDDDSESQQSVSHNDNSFKEADVLLGRGGLVNLHPGNQAYLQHKERLQARYLAASKEEKTEISQELVDIVHDWGGRFMKQSEDNEHIWYEVDNLKARKKASQTLREINTPEHRAYKRKKYVETKKAKKARTTD
jgi:hypothetical protein